MRRLEGVSAAPIIFGVLVAITPIIWIFIYDSPLDNSQRILYAIVIAIACGLGSHFGLRAGLKSQIVFQKKMEEYLRSSGQLQNDSTSTSDNLNNN